MTDQHGFGNHAAESARSCQSNHNAQQMSEWMREKRILAMVSRHQNRRTALIFVIRHGQVFPRVGNPGQHIGQHQRLHAAVVKRSGVHCVPYDFRHTFASRAANEESVPLPILVAIMGHSNLRSIMKYVHTSQEQMDRETLLNSDAFLSLPIFPVSSLFGPAATGPTPGRVFALGEAPDGYRTGR
jgi:hypothetical protein